MLIKRYAYEHVTRVYNLDVDQDSLDELNAALNETMNGHEHPEVTWPMLIAVAMGEEDMVPELNFDLDGQTELYSWCYTLYDWIKEWLNERIWDSENNYVDDGETDDWSDYVELETDEQITWNEYRKGNTSPEAQND